MRLTKTRIRDVLGNPGNCAPVCLPSAVDLIAFNWMSHGTQDVYPTFLTATTDHGGLSSLTARWIVVIYNNGAIIVAVWRSARWEPGSAAVTHRSLCVALGLCRSCRCSLTRRTAAMLCLGLFLMQVCTGCLGRDPRAHLTEMSPDAIRGRLPRRNLPARQSAGGVQPSYLRSLAELPWLPFALPRRSYRVIGRSGVDGD